MPEAEVSALAVAFRPNKPLACGVLNIDIWGPFIG